MVNELRLLVQGGFVLLADYVEFSRLHRLHLFVRLVYDSALPRIFHTMSYSVFFSLRDHICLLSSVAFRSLGLVKDCLWLAYLSLNI